MAQCLGRIIGAKGKMMGLTGRCLAMLILTLSGACISTGTTAITDRSLMGQIQVDKSTKTDVEELLGFPTVASYPGDQEVWNYFFRTDKPEFGNYILLANIVWDGFCHETRVFTVTFNRDGIVKNMEQKQTSKGENIDNLPY